MRRRRQERIGVRLLQKAWTLSADRLERRCAAGEVVRILLDEQIHHGAEIALLRDLYVRRDR